MRKIALMFVLVAVNIGGAGGRRSAAAVLCAGRRFGNVHLRAACTPREIAIDVAALALPDPPECPADAVKAATLCVDKYEASLWRIPQDKKQLIAKVRRGEATAGDLIAGGASQVGVTGSVFSGVEMPENFPDTGNWTPLPGTNPPHPGIYAASVAGVLPQGAISWFQAVQACALSGKRLLTNEEWQRAAAGTPDPDLLDDGVTTCVTNSPVADRTGARIHCVSNWGAHDMVGNMWEWVSDWGDLVQNADCPHWDAAFGNDLTCFGSDGSVGSMPAAFIRGGDWNSIGAGAGVFAIDNRNPPSRPEFGFRCGR